MKIIENNKRNNGECNSISIITNVNRIYNQNVQMIRLDKK